MQPRETSISRETERIEAPSQELAGGDLHDMDGVAHDVGRTLRALGGFAGGSTV